RDMKIVHSVARDVRILAREISNHLRVPVSLRQNYEGSRCAEVFDETPAIGERQRMGKDGAMSGNAQEFVDDRPSGKPSFRGRSPVREQASHPLLRGRAFVSRIEKQVRIDDKQASALLPGPPVQPRVA